MERSQNRNEPRVTVGLAALVFAISIGCGGAGSTSTSTSTSGSTGLAGGLPANKILFSEFSGEDAFLKMVNADGSGLTTVATLPENVSSAAQSVSSSGEFFFSAGQTGEGRIFGPFKIFRGDSALNSITASALTSILFEEISNIQVSPDGSTVFFLGRRNSFSEPWIYRINRLGGSPLEIAPAVAYEVSPTAPLRIAYIDAGLGRPVDTLYIRGIGPGDARREITRGVLLQSVSWNRAGTQLIFSASTGASQDLIGVSSIGDVTTNNPLQITNTSEVDEYNPGFSPDGTKIVCDVYVGNQTQGLHTMNADGSSKLLLVPFSGSNGFFGKPYWTNSQGRSREGAFRFDRKSRFGRK